MKESVKSFTKIISYVMAACVILFALLVVASGLLTPELEKHHSEIEAWASKSLGVPVTIKEVHLSWFQYQPVVTLEKVTAHNVKANKPILEIQKIRVFFSIPKSLARKEIVLSGLMLTGSDIKVFMSSSGQYTVKGFPSLGDFSEQPYESNTNFSDILAWLSKQETNIILSDIDIHFESANGVKRFVTLYHLRFRNDGNKHAILGKALLHQEISTEVEVVSEWEGDGSDSKKIIANAYFHLRGLSCAQWLQGKTWLGWRMDEGVANAKIWVTWGDGSLQRAQTRFESYGLKLYSTKDKSTHVITRLSGDLAWKKQGDQEIFAGDDIFIDLPAHLWPSTSFNVVMKPDSTGKLQPLSVKTGYFNLEDVQAFLHALPEMFTQNQLKILGQLNLTGDIDSLSVDLDGSKIDSKHVKGESRFSRLTFSPWQNWPGVKNISGAFKWNGDQAELALKSSRTTITANSIFASPLNFEHLTGSLLLKQADNKSWMLEIAGLTAVNQDLVLNTDGTMLLGDAPVADLVSTFTLYNANRVSRYLPMKIFEAGLNQWLNQAFLDGKVQNGDIKLRGPLNDFPFDKGNGEFKISGNIKNVDFRFAPDWPLLNKVNGKLIFAGRKIDINIDHAETQGIPVKNVTGTIPNLGDDSSPSILTVVAKNIQTDFSSALDYVHSSPLEQSIGKMFESAEAKGLVTLDLSLSVPLLNPEKTKVDGHLLIKDALLRLKPWRLDIEKLNGQAHFTESTTEATGITGEVFNQPLVLGLQTVQTTKKDSVVRASVTSKVVMSDLEKWLKVPFSKYAEGETDVLLDIDFAFDAPMVAKIQSNLVGLQVNLDGEYSKEKSVPRNYSAIITVQDKKPLQIQMSYGNLLGAALLLESRADTFDLIGVDVSLGEGMAAMPEGPGLYLSGKLDKLDWDAIKKYSQSTGTSSIPSLPLRSIDLQVGSIELGGQEIKAVSLQVVPEDNDWVVDIKSAAMTGQVTFPIKLTSQSVVDAHFQQINLNTQANSKSTLVVDAKSLPAINFAAKNVTYNNMPLGQVTLKTSPSNKGLEIKTLNVNSRYLDLHATGAWTGSQGSSSTRLQGVATTTEMSKLLNSFGFDVHNFVASNGKFEFGLSWNNAPYDLSLATMDGHVRMDLAKGRIVEVGQTSGAKMDLGRMLSIFSLQTIPRRLSLDFSDVFQKGYSFDFFRGDFKFEDGDAYTSNMRIDGPVARVDIYGRIGLVAKDVDLTMSVTPNVSASIPVAATLLTGQPVIGIAAWAVNNVISSQISKATTYYYAVRGAWGNPSWDSISVPGKKAS